MDIKCVALRRINRKENCVSQCDQLQLITIDRSLCSDLVHITPCSTDFTVDPDGVEPVKEIFSTHSSLSSIQFRQYTYMITNI